MNPADNLIPWGKPIYLWPRQISWCLLNLLEVVTWHRRKSIMVAFSKKKLKLSSYEDVAKYIIWLLTK